MSHPVILSPHVQDQILEALVWWHANRDKAPRLLEQEIDRALTVISERPRLGAKLASTRVSGLQRILLRKTRFHLYYQHDLETDEVYVLALWQAERESLPPLP